MKNLFKKTRIENLLATKNEEGKTIYNVSVTDIGKFKTKETLIGNFNTLEEAKAALTGYNLKG